MNLNIRQGETLEITVVADDQSAQSVRLTVSNDDDELIIDETAEFELIDNKWSAYIMTNNTNHEVAEYDYMLTLDYGGGLINKLPDLTDCEGCELPKLIICKANDLEENEPD